MPVSKHTTRRSGNAGNYSARGYDIDMIIIHHAASTSLSGVLNMMATGSREVSSNYVVEDSEIVSVVDEKYRAFTSASPRYDGKAITFEIINNSVSGWTISEESYHSVAKVIADASARYGFPIDREHIIGHNEVYARFGQGYPTACPGGVSLYKIVTLAQSYAEGDTFLSALNRDEQRRLLGQSDKFDSVVGRQLLPVLERLDLMRFRFEKFLEGWEAKVRQIVQDELAGR